MNRIQKWQFNVLILLALSILSMSVFAEMQSKKIPKWKLEHQANIANSAKVCASPIISKSINPLNLTTGFYTINVNGNTQPAYIEIDEHGQVVLQHSQPSKARRWLFTYFGGDGYAIATCYDGQPACLTSSENKHVAITTCDQIDYGAQRWWLKGYGQNRGGSIFGSDAIGQLDCVENSAKNSLLIQPCSDANGWDISRVEKPTFLPQAAKDQVVLDFPNLAQTIDYQCDSGAVISTYYDENQDEMMVNYNAQILKLKSVMSASGAKFGEAHEPWGWWTKADKGMIYQTKGEGAVLENCTEVRALNPTRVWQANDFGDSAAVADCTDCEEDLGMVMRCNKGDIHANVTVYLDAAEAVKSKQYIIAVDVDSDLYKYPIDAPYIEMIGHHVAEFQVHKNDRIFYALQQGRNATFKVANGEMKTIGLTGSKRAISQFRSACGW